MESSRSLTATTAFRGKDILARAKTGSGKTGAYAIPILQKILSKKEVAADVSLHLLFFPIDQLITDDWVYVF